MGILGSSKRIRTRRHAKTGIVIPIGQIKRAESPHYSTTSPSYQTRLLQRPIFARGHQPPSLVRVARRSRRAALAIHPQNAFAGGRTEVLRKLCGNFIEPYL